MERKINEECGIFGIFGEAKHSHQTARTVYYALYALQHRGQQSCGISIGNREKKVVVCHKDLGLVSEVFDGSILDTLDGDMAVGHTRYASADKNTRDNAQPLSINYNKGTLSIVLNGAIANAPELRRILEKQGAIFQSTGDTEVIACLISRERLVSKSIEEAVSRVVPLLKGAFSMLVMSPQKLIAVRDPYGIRPLCIGRVGSATVFASESCAISAVGGKFLRDLDPGEIVLVTDDGIESIRDHCGGNQAMCIFEHIYFARPDSIIDGQSVYESRLEAGRILAEASPVDADIVIGVPDSGLIAAMGYAEKSGIPYREGLIRNRYIGRTFIQPRQGERAQSVMIKLGPIEANVKGKRVVMVDDSIVRGTTINQLVELLRYAGAAEVHIRISSPEFLWPCYFGTDIPSRDRLALVKYTKDEFCKKIGADSLEFLPLDRVTDVAKNSKVKFCDACFSGKYPFDVTEDLAQKDFEYNIEKR